MQPAIPMPEALRRPLADHPMYAALTGPEDLRVLMSHHIYAVWDFMGLLKALQHHLAPSGTPWSPAGDATLRRFVNEIVLEEECDEAPAGLADRSPYLSHVELYAHAMREIGADPDPALAFFADAAARGLEAALERHPKVPPPAADFMRRTWRFVDSGHPHVVAAAFAYGREQIIPDMYRSLLSRLGIGAGTAPAFHAYLSRHVELDGERHGPVSALLVQRLCGDDPQRRREAEAAVREALEARIVLWDGVLAALESQRAAGD